MSLFCTLLLASPSLANQVCTWSNGWDNVPDEATDQVVLLAGDLNYGAGLNDTVASWTHLPGYTGTVTVDTRFPGQGGFSTLTISGDCIVSNGTITHAANTGSNIEVERVVLVIGGDLEIAAAGEIHLYPLVIAARTDAQIDLTSADFAPSLALYVDDGVDDRRGENLVAAVDTGTVQIVQELAPGSYLVEA